MLRARPLIDVVTDTNPLSGINGLEGWQEAIARIIALRDHAWDFDLRGIAAQLIEEHPDLLKALPCIGSGLFAVTWFLKWWFVKWWTGGRGDDGRIDDIEQVQEADNEEDLPTDNIPDIFAENTVITLIHKRKIANNPVQYRFHIENLPHDADNWAGRYALMKLFGSEEALEEAIEKYDSMSLLWDPKLLPRVKAVGVDHVKMFRLGKV